MNDNMIGITKKLYEGDSEAVAELVQASLDAGIEPEDVLDNALIAAMDEVGRDFKVGDLFVPEVLRAAQAMQAGMGVLRPLLAERNVDSAGKYVIGTVKGDLHDIGKNLVKMMLEGNGYEVIDLGIDVEASVFVDAVREHNPTLIGISAMLTTTMTQMKEIIDSLEEAGLRKKVKVMIGGAPVTAAYAEQIGADAYATDAIGAVDKARDMIDKT